MDTTIEAASPATAVTAPKGDGKERSGNLTMGEAVARLHAEANAEVASGTQKPAQTAAVETAPGEESATTETPAAEAQGASAETTSIEETPLEAAAEATTETVPAQGGGEDEVLSPKTSQIDDRTKEKIQKVVNKAKAAEKAAEAQVELLKREVEALKARVTAPPQQEAQSQAQQMPMAPVGQPPMPDIKDGTDITKAKQAAKEAIRWAEEQLDRDEVQAGDGVQLGDKTYTKAELKNIVRRAKVSLEDHIPAQEQYLQAQVTFNQVRAQAQQAAYAEFPFLKDKATPEYQRAQAIYRELPILSAMPNADYVAGVLVEGLKAMEARKEVAAKAKAADAKPKLKVTAKPAGDQAVVSTAVSSTTRAPADSLAKQSVAAEREKLKAKGNVSAADAVAFLQRTQQLRNSR